MLKKTTAKFYLCVFDSVTIFTNSWNKERKLVDVICFFSLWYDECPSPSLWPLLISQVWRAGTRVSVFRQGAQKLSYATEGEPFNAFTSRPDSLSPATVNEPDVTFAPQKSLILDRWRRERAFVRTTIVPSVALRGETVGPISTGPHSGIKSPSALRRQKIFTLKRSDRFRWNFVTLLYSLAIRRVQGWMASFSRSLILNGGTFFSTWKRSITLRQSWIYRPYLSKKLKIKVQSSLVILLQAIGGSRWTGGDSGDEWWGQWTCQWEEWWRLVTLPLPRSRAQLRRRWACIRFTFTTFFYYLLVLCRYLLDELSDVPLSSGPRWIAK